MARDLSEMTLQELWQLFPIILTAPDPAWPDWYAQESARLMAALPGARKLRMNHMGSTAIRGIWAKPTVDILLEAPPGRDLDALARDIQAWGYTLMSRGDERASFCRGYTPEGFAERVFHLHLRRYGDNDELYFRDLMNAEPALAHEYEQLKLALWHQYEHDRDGYTARKGEFVARCTAQARARFAGRY